MPTQGSPPKALAPSDTWTVVKSTLYTLGAAVLAAGAVAGLDGLIAQVIPDLEKRGAIDATLAVLLTAVFDAIRKAVQTWAVDTRRVSGWLLLAACLSLPGVAEAQSVKLPAQVTGGVGDFVVVTADTEDTTVKWFVVDKALKLFPQELQNDTKKAVVIALTPGSYRLLAVSAKDGTPSDFAECIVAIGGVIPPPGPDPPPPVPPPPDPTPAGVRELVIIRETADTTPQQASLLTSLRFGPHAEYLRSKGHKLYVLDDDSSGSFADRWRQIVAGLTLPAIVIVDQKDRTVLVKESLPGSAEAVMELLKKHGG